VFISTQHTTRPWHQEFQKTTFEWSQDWILDSKLGATQKNDNKTDKQEVDNEEQATVTPFRGMPKQGHLRGQLHMGGKDQIENTASNSSSVVACLFIATEMCLLCCYLTVAAPYSTIPAFSLHDTVYSCSSFSTCGTIFTMNCTFNSRNSFWGFSLCSWAHQITSSWSFAVQHAHALPIVHKH
jgi:hypothetical protein